MTTAQIFATMNLQTKNSTKKVLKKLKFSIDNDKTTCYNEITIKKGQPIKKRLYGKKEW